MINHRKSWLTLLGGLVLTAVPAAYADTVELTDAPLFVSQTADPNVTFLLDDSGSMRWGFIPDSLALDGFNFDHTDTVEFSNGSSRTYGVCPSSTENYAGFEKCFFDLKNRQYLASNTGNPMYYDPETEYSPPMKGDGTQFDDADFDKALVDGYSSDGETIDLGSEYRAIMDEYFWACESGERDRNQCLRYYLVDEDGDWIKDDEGNYEYVFNGVGFAISENANGDSAFYYELKDSCDSDSRADNCYQKQSLKNADADDKQNFANWFSYYRNRILASRAGITGAFVDQSEGMRLGYGAINAGDTIVRGVRPFTNDPPTAYADAGEDGNFRTEFFKWLHTADASGGTPLRQALSDAGEYYAETDENDNPLDDGPWSTYPGISDDERFLECRPSVSILMTDGFWNGGDPDGVAIGNEDGTSGPTDPIEGPSDPSFKYEPRDPFKDSYDTTLADVAMHYWKRDLQPGIENRIPTSSGGEDEGVVSPAFWQHMSTYGVGFGVSGSIDPDDAFDAIETETSIDWPDPHPAGNSEAKIDDLLHAGVNSRGGFFEAGDPDEFSSELSTLLTNFMEQVGSSTGVTFDTATLEEDSLIFAAQFDSTDWSGDLFASPLETDDKDGSQPPEIGKEIWSAADKLDTPDFDSSPRQIITSDGGKGIAFKWADHEDLSDDLNDTQLADLRFGGSTDAERESLARARVDYLRGDRSKEGRQEGDFRVRGSRLGDIVNSTPVRVTSPGSGWPDAELFGGMDNPYSDFRGENSDRTPVIYTGANDGMLHGFKATEDGGEELLAFMPSAIFSDEKDSGLHYLTSRRYGHEYYVDLPPLAADAFIRGRKGNGGVEDKPAWRTVLLGGSRTGERAIFALDVTDPNKFKEANAAELMLWEFTADDDPRMGYITEPPIIALAKWDNNDHRWTAFFGNGYNSPQKATGIFMLDLEGGLDGEWDENADDYRFIEFRGENDNNVTGLSPIAAYDDTGDRIVDRLYGGDLDGNMWVAEAGNQGIGNPDTYRLFSAANDVGERQPITASPLVIKDVSDEDDGGGKGKNKDSAERLVLFGTGQYLNNADLTNDQTQTFYAVRDQSGANFDRGDLTPRDLVDREIDGTEVLFSEERIEGNAITNGWYVDLFEDRERITLSPQVRGDFIFVTSSIPNTNPCVAGGASRTMAFGLDGLTPDIPVFTAFDEAVVSYRQDDGIASESAFLGNFRFTPTSTGEVNVEGVDTGAPDELMGRQGWQELIE